MANKLLINHKYIEIQCERNDAITQAQVALVPFIHSNRIRTSHITSCRNIDLVLKLFRDIDETNYDKLPPAVKEVYVNEMQRRSVTEMLLKNGPVDDCGFLYRHQQLGRELARVNKRFAFYYATGTGKTPMSLSIIADDIAQNPNHKWLIVCPLSLVRTAWVEDCNEFFPSLTIQPLHATTKLARQKLFKVSANIYVINFDAVDSYRFELDSLNIHGMIVDESSKLKNHSSLISRSLVNFSEKLERVYLLSGTPASNGMHEYYTQIKCLDLYGISQSYTAFEKHFFNNVSFNPMFKVLQIKAELKDSLLNHIKKYSIYVAKEDCLDLPDKVFIDRKISLPPDVKKEYDKMRKELCVSIGEDINILAQSTVSMLNKLNQISSGFLIDTELQVVHRLSTFKVKELVEVLEELGNEQVVIWANYREEYKMIKEALGADCVEYHGGTNITDKDDAVAKFKAGKVKYFVANPISAGHGLTLTNASYMIFFSYNYSLELYVQALDRIHRIGQTNKCTYISLLAKGTIDEVIYKVVKDKGDLAFEALNHLKGG